MEIKNLKKLAVRIKKAIERKEKIILYADSDLDGTIAVIIAKEAILNLGGQAPLIYFSDRKSEEHGLNEQGFRFLKSRAPGLLLCLDCGIADFNEVEQAKKLGFEVLILDHHEPQEKLPKASIIVDPKTGKKNDYYYHLAAAALSLKLAEILLGKKMTGYLKEDMAGLTALASVSDMVPETEVNKAIIEGGLPFLETTSRSAIRKAFNSSVVQGCLSTRQIVAKIIKIINITDKEGDLSELYLFLISTSEEETEMRFKNFLKKGSERQVQIERLTDEFKKKNWAEKREIIFDGSEDLPYRFIGAVASRLTTFFLKPVFLYDKGKDENRGGFRMPDKEKDGVKALSSCKKYLRSFGGHAAAGGFIFKDKDKKKIEQCLIKYFQKRS